MFQQACLKFPVFDKKTSILFPKVLKAFGHLNHHKYVVFCFTNSDDVLHLLEEKANDAGPDEIVFLQQPERNNLVRVWVFTLCTVTLVPLFSHFGYPFFFSESSQHGRKV